MFDTQHRILSGLVAVEDEEIDGPAGCVVELTVLEKSDVSGLESSDGEPKPQADEGITDCQWRSLEEALETLSYDNARGVLKRAGEMVRTLVAVGAGRSRPAAERQARS